MKIRKLVLVKVTPTILFPYLAVAKKQKEWLPELVDMKIKKLKGAVVFESYFLEGGKVCKHAGIVKEHVKDTKLVVLLYDKSMNVETSYTLSDHAENYCNLEVVVDFQVNNKMVCITLPFVFLYANFLLSKKLKMLKEVVESSVKFA